jgi:hypothetical protein
VTLFLNKLHAPSEGSRRNQKSTVLSTPEKTLDTMQTIKIFLASSGELKAERDGIFKIVADVGVEVFLGWGVEGFFENKNAPFQFRAIGRNGAFFSAKKQKNYSRQTAYCSRESGLLSTARRYRRR